MGRITIPGGGGGADTSVVTATASDVLKNKVIVDAEGNPISGTLELTGDAGAAQVLSGSTFYSTDAKSKQTGTMTDNGAVSPSALGAGGSYTIPAGYHNGKGKVTVQSLATMTASGDATAAQILTGKKAYVDGSLITGTMTDQGTKNSSLNCGGSYTIPAGYHNGSGKVTANSLSSQTSATATAARILSGYTAWVNGSKLTGSLAVTSAISFSAAAQSATSIRISWTNPSKGPYSGIKIRYSKSSYPGVSGGTLAYTGTGSSTSAGGTSYVDITGLSAGTTYYFSCYSYATGIGDSVTSYNCTAKTTGLLLYSYGNNIAGYYPASSSGSTLAEFKSDHIYCPYNSSYSTNSIESDYVLPSLDSYSVLPKVYLKVMFTGTQYTAYSNAHVGWGWTYYLKAGKPYGGGHRSDYLFETYKNTLMTTSIDITSDINNVPASDQAKTMINHEIKWYCSTRTVAPPGNSQYTVTNRTSVKVYEIWIA